MKKQYISPPLRNKLGRISSCAFSLIEAPAGYGKTTAVRYLVKFMEKEPQVYWYTAMAGGEDNSVDWFIRQIAALEPETGKQLKALGRLNRSNAAAAAELLLALRVERPCYLILDNFQYIMHNWQLPVLFALADRSADGLHVVLISQNFGRLRAALEDTASICLIKTRDLCLNTENIIRYAQQQEIKITRQQAEEIYEYTEGWAAAVSLCLGNLRDGSLDMAAVTDIDSLLYEFFWKKISWRQQEWLMSLCPFEGLSEEHARQLLGLGQMQYEQAGMLFAQVPLVRYEPASGIYYPHEILLRFVRRQLKKQPEEFQRKVCRLAGEWYKKEGRTRCAVECFFLALDYEGLLSCELIGLLAEKFADVTYTQLARQVLTDCPLTVQEKYPLSVLRLCMALFAGADFSGFEQAMRQTRGFLEKNGDSHMMGEWFLVSAFLSFPDVEAMKQRYLQADPMLTGPSRVFVKEEPFMFGTTSMWYLFYTKPGKMMETGEKLREMLEVYNRLTDNHGAGAYELYMGEALSVQAQFDESDIYAHKAALLSERYQNASATYGAALLLGINAIYQSDMISLNKAIDYLENKALAYPFLQGTALNRLMTETVRTYLLGLMLEPCRSPEWAQGKADSLGDLTFTNFMIKTNRVTDMILQKEYKRAIASVESSLVLDERLVSLSTRNFMYVGLALCYLAIGRPVKAAEWLDKSLTIAGQDKNYTFLACFKKYLSVLFLFPAINSRHRDSIKEIKELELHYTRPGETHIFEMLEKKEPEQLQKLTGREREIADMVARGLRNKEIAQELFISEETVKSHIRSIFNKTNVDRRSQLIELLK